MKKKLIVAGALVGLTILFGAASCDTTAVTAAACTDAVTTQNSGLKFTANQQLVLTGLLSACTATSMGTVFNNTTAATALLSEAILVQQSGLLSNVHITALAPEKQKSMTKIKARWDHFEKFHSFD